MKLRIFSFENEIIFSEEYISVLQIEENVLFAQIIESINQRIIGSEKQIENLVLLDEDNELKFQKEVLLITDPWNFDFNQKKIQTALFQYIENIYKLEYDKMSEFQSLFQQLEVGVSDVWDELPFTFEYKDNIGISEYLKLVGLKIQQKECGVIQKVLSIIDVVEYFDIVKLIVFVNLKLFLNEKQLLEVYKYARYKKVNLLLLETGKEKEPVEGEKIWLIDSDYDEIILYNGL